MSADDRQDPQPSKGDVLITTEAGSHYLSIVPYPHRMSFKEFPNALTIARNWVKANGGAIWRSKEGETFRVQN